MDDIIEKLVGNYSTVVEKAIKETEANEEQSRILREKFVSKFRANLEIGLTSVFGKDSEGKQLSTPLTEVTVDDVLKNEEAILRTVMKRKKNPKKAAMILEMIYKKNRQSLKEIQVNTGKRKLDLSGINDSSDNFMECFADVSKKLKETQNRVVETKDKATRLLDAFMIMKNVEEAVKVKEEVMHKT